MQDLDWSGTLQEVMLEHDMYPGEHEYLAAGAIALSCRTIDEAKEKYLKLLMTLRKKVHEMPYRWLWLTATDSHEYAMATTF